MRQMAEQQRVYGAQLVRREDFEVIWSDAPYNSRREAEEAGRMAAAVFAVVKNMTGELPWFVRVVEKATS